MIRTFEDRYTATIWKGERVKKYSTRLQIETMEKLELIDKAENVEELRNPPGNHLEILKGNRKGQYSIRINIQYRICFRFIDGNAYDVELVDYHK